MTMPAVRIRIRGQVQGVGFRPFVWHLARENGVAGEVLNDGAGVLIHAEHAQEAVLERFVARLAAEPPLLARIDALERTRAAPRGCTGFEIVATVADAVRTRVTPDAVVCAACLAEIFDPASRRHRYPFTNCTHCGPRFSILERVPYDRAATTMAAFGLCEDCRREYADPADRRFHAQPIACPCCGPHARIEPAGGAIDATGGEDAAGGDGTEDAVRAAARRLRRGEVVAVKALGGFHLACNALDEAAVARLRARKRRPTKPFAVMVRDLAMVRRYARAGAAEAALLSAPAAPIVLLEAAGAPLAPSVAPGQWALGVMLPTTPLHALLMADVDGPLVMTSGNRSGEPQAIDDEQARARLGACADAFLTHDRPIARRLDDSVAMVTGGRPRVLRRARGYAPATLPLPAGFETAPPVAAYGAQLKSAFCLTRDGAALLSHHLGDLDDILTAGEFATAVRDYGELFAHEPAVIACDLHPDYRSSAAARARAEALGVPLEEVQHHHAHVAATMVEAGWPLGAGPVLGVALDGLGLGTDGTVWGCEFLLADYRRADRLATLRPVPLPGGEAAQREPWRNLLAHLDAAGLAQAADRLLAGRPLATVRAAVAQDLNAPPSSSAGRLFDAVAAAAGLAPERQSHEGEAAMRLETAARGAVGNAAPYPFGTVEHGRLLLLEPRPMWQCLLADRARGLPATVIAKRFHEGLAGAVAALAVRLAEREGAGAIALSGGVMQNRTLLEACLDRLAGRTLLTHGETPPNDGAVALGQAAVAAARRTG